MTRTTWTLVTAALAALAFTPAAHAVGEPITVLKTSGCGCCLSWIKRIEEAGFRVTAKNAAMGDLMQTKLKAEGLTVEQTSCHTGQIAGYVVEGHVPVREIRRLLEERPDAVGLSLPGMPLGSPGMEVGGDAEPYEVLLVRKDGTAEVFARYP
jgi:hypothetical protein